ncbi:MAG: hypothetical protein ACE5OZ_22945 [Candidatus Heimdallarchaeota archaeon]
MNGNKASTGSSLTEGMIVTMFMDTGPENIYNSSPLDENEAIGMAIKHLAAVATHTPDTGEIYSFGPLPTPKRPYETLAFVFLVKATDSIDVRLTHFGRVVVFWIITKSSATVKYANILKQMVQRSIRSYNIINDLDIQKKGILEKIDKKLAIVEAGMEAYYISEGKTFEPFMELALVPPKAPIVLIDSANRQFRVLLRDKTSGSGIAELRRIIDDYKQQASKGATYKVEFITDTLKGEVLLSKLGFMTQTSVGQQFQAFLLGKPTFGDFDDFFGSYLNPRRHQLVNQVLKSLESRTALNLQELAKETGIFTELIELILENAISKGLIQKAKVENQTLLFLPNH